MLDERGGGEFAVSLLDCVGELYTEEGLPQPACLFALRLREEVGGVSDRSWSAHATAMGECLGE